MNLLVTGAAGFIGSHVVDRLLGRGDSVTGVDNFDPFYPAEEKRENLRDALASPRFRLVEADIADFDALSAALGEHAFDGIIHLAAKAGIRTSFDDPVGYARANILGTQSVLELARTRDARRIVFGSSSSVFGDCPALPFEESRIGRPLSPYAATKRAAEVLCEAHQAAHGGAVFCLRFFSVYGPRQRPDLVIRRFSGLMEKGRPIQVFGGGDSARDYTWIDDVVDGILAAMGRAEREDGCEIVNLGTGRATSIMRVVQLIGQAMDCVPVVEYRPVQSGDVPRTLADIGRARRLLGFEPSVGIEEGISRLFSSRLSAGRGPRPAGD